MTKATVMLKAAVMKLGSVFLVLLLLAFPLACSSNNSTTQNDTTNPVSCFATTSSVVGNQIGLSVSISGGTPNYSITSVTLNGQTTTALGGTTTGLTATASLTASFASVVAGSLGDITVVDSSSTPQSATCTFNASTSAVTTPTTTAAGLSCSITMSASPVTVGQTVQATIQVIGGTGSERIVSGYSPPNAMLRGYFSGPLTAVMQYGAQGTFLLAFLIEDASGNQGICSAEITAD